MNGILLIIILLLIYIDILTIYAIFSQHEVIEIQRAEYNALEINRDLYKESCEELRNDIEDLELKNHTYEANFKKIKSLYNSAYIMSEEEFLNKMKTILESLETN